MSPAEKRLREALRTKQRPIPFVGSGLSLAATGNKVAGWYGLLLNGIDTCEEADPALKQRNWGDPLREKLKGICATTLLLAAKSANVCTT